MAKDDNARISEILNRGAEEVIDRKHLEAALASGVKLRVKLGIDPTAPDLHLGHAVVLRKLKAFQDLGHTIVLIIGDFTARIGDPSGRDKTRPPLTESEVASNMKNYLRQAGKILNIKKTEVVHNKKWLGRLSGVDLFELLSQISVQQIMERDDFKKRLAAQQSIRMHELLYPVMQGYDSVAIKADVELGGTDQTFNLLVGRSLMEKRGMKPQDILTVPLLEGTDGERKMSKSLGNYIGIADEPNDMFGKIMSIPDRLVGKYFLLCTDLTGVDIDAFKKALKPKELKERLGVEIVKLYHGEKAATAARENFEKLFSKGEIPDDVPELKLGTKSISTLDLVMKSGVLKSKSEARRLIEQGGLELSGRTVTDPQATQQCTGGEIVRIGKKRFFKLKI